MKSKLLFTSCMCCFVFLNGILAQTFTKITDSPLVIAGSESMFCAWGDYDNDGDEDLFVSNGQFSVQTNYLFINGGSENDFAYTLATDGDIVTDKSDSKGAGWGDYDNDGDLDLFVANCDIGIYDYLYQNNGDGTFIRIIDGSLVASNSLKYT